ncbi:hypothetical protein KEF29_03610 [Streptomyces tuirus]|uniref:Uncharacterized protein n=1 Tax=Streptomyces tuirus TaxID=68278 RepID=A0A941F8C5_9ACTN|nr:hypothetical protein [Streptomyces tuirus]
MKVNGAALTKLAEDLAAYEGHPDLGFACCTAHAVADHVPGLRAEIERLSERVARLEDDKVRRLDQQAKDDDEYIQVLAERDRYRLAWLSARERAQAYDEGILRVVKDRESYQGWLKQEQAFTQHLQARIAELEAERHTTNEALTDAAEALRANRDRIAELEKAAEQIRHLHKDSPMGPCPVCIDADAMTRDEDYTLPYPCPTARLAGAKDCDPPSFRAAQPETTPEEAVS